MSCLANATLAVPEDNVLLLMAVRYVARLVLLHGRAAYKRNTEVVLYSFYKNWVYNLTYVYFAFVNGKQTTVTS